MALSCPRGTQISIELAQYGNSLKGKELISLEDTTFASNVIESLSRFLIYRLPYFQSFPMILFYVAIMFSIKLVYEVNRKKVFSHVKLTASSSMNKFFR